MMSLGLSRTWCTSFRSSIQLLPMYLRSGRSQSRFRQHVKRHTTRARANGAADGRETELIRYSNGGRGMVWARAQLHEVIHVAQAREGGDLVVLERELREAREAVQPLDLGQAVLAEVEAPQVDEVLEPAAARRSE